MKMGVKTIANDKSSLVKRTYVTLYSLIWVKEDTLSIFSVYFNKDIFEKKLDVLLSLLFS